VWYEGSDDDCSWLLKSSGSPLPGKTAKKDKQISKACLSSPIYLANISIPNVWGAK
jgi:hypothetical protein